MRTIVTTWKKELMSYFFNPVAYVILVLFYLLRGFEVRSLTAAWILFDQDVDKYPGQVLLGQAMVIMMLLVPPILTMRCFAEERRTGSLEVLMTAPVRDHEIVLGKWLAAATFFAVLWVPTLVLLLVSTAAPYLATPLPLGIMLSGFLGLLLLGAMLLAIGCFTSSLTDNQLVASLAAIILNYGLLAGPSYLRLQLQQAVAEHPWLLRAFDVIDAVNHLQSWFMAGLVDTGRVLYFLAGTGLFLFLTVKALEARAWR